MHSTVNVLNGKSGYTVGSNTIKFNQGTDYFKDGKYVLTDSDLTMKALEGYIYNDMAQKNLAKMKEIMD